MVSNKNFIEFQEQIGKVKHLHRTGWVIRHVPNPETVAAHSWRMALMTIYKEKELKKLGADIDHIIEMCLLHDVGESVVGDIVPELHQTGSEKISKEKKKHIEEEAIKFLAHKYNFPQLRASFDEYEAQKTLESNVVKNFDKLDMLLQAYEYSLAYPNLARLNEFMEYNEKDVDLPLFLSDIQEIKSRQFQNKKNKNKFIDSLIRAGHFKHQLHDPTGSNISNYDTTASHLFRMAIILLYLRADSKLIKSVVAMNTDNQFISELETLENILQAYEYFKLYPKERPLDTYIRENKKKITIPSLKKLLLNRKCSSAACSQRNMLKQR